MQLNLYLRSFYQVEVVLDNDNGDLPKALRLNNILCHILPTRTWRYLPTLLRLVSIRRYDLIYANNFCGRAVNGLWIARLTKRFFIWHIRESLHSTTFTQWLPQANLIIANSEYTARRIRLYAPQQNIVTIPNGVVLENFQIDHNYARQYLCNLLNLPHDSIILVNVGGICPDKNQLDSVAAVSQLAAKHTEVVLLLIGPFPEESYRKKLNQCIADLNAENCIRIIGPREDIAVCMRGADILLHTAQKETQGRVILEAMAARLPVVAYNVGGVGESIVDGDTGFLISFRDINSLVQAVCKLIENPEIRIRMGDSGYRRVKQKFSAEQMSLKVRQVIDETLHQ